MLAFSFVLAILAMAALAGKSGVTPLDVRTKQRLGSAARALFVLAGVFLAVSSFRTVRTGHVGVKRLFGRVEMARPLGPGLHVVFPLVDVVQMNEQVDTYTMSASHGEGQVIGDDAIDAITRDALTLRLEVSVPFRLVGVDAPWILQNIGTRQAYEEKVIRPSIRTGVRESTSFFTAQEAYALKRDSLAILMHERVSDHIKGLLDQYPAFDGTAFEIYDVMLRDVVLPDKVKHAIEEKLEADQQAQKMEFVLLREAKEAERKRIEAQGIKDFQDIVRQGIDEKLLVWKGIEATEKLATSANTKMVFFNGEKGGLPLVLTADGIAEK